MRRADYAHDAGTAPGSIDLAASERQGVDRARRRVLPAACHDRYLRSCSELFRRKSGTSCANAHASSMNVVRDGSVGALLPNGKVLIAGGNEAQAAASTELYTP